MRVTGVPSEKRMFLYPLTAPTISVKLTSAPVPTSRVADANPRFTNAMNGFGFSRAGAIVKSGSPSCTVGTFGRVADLSSLSASALPMPEWPIVSVGVKMSSSPSPLILEVMKKRTFSSPTMCATKRRASGVARVRCSMTTASAVSEPCAPERHTEPTTMRGWLLFGSSDAVGGMITDVPSSHTRCGRALLWTLVVQKTDIDVAFFVVCLVPGRGFMW